MKMNMYVRFAMHHKWIEGYYIEREIWDHEIIYIEEGSMRITIEDVEHIVKEGDVVLLRPHVPHKIEWNGEDCKQPHVHFDFIERGDSNNVGVSLKTSAQMSREDIARFRDDYLEKNNIEIPFVFHLKQPKIIRTLLFKIIDEYEYGFYESTKILKGLLMQLYAHILRDYKLTVNEIENKDRDLIEFIVSYMVENMDNSISLDELVYYSKLDKWTLNQIFKKVYNLTPMKYYNSLRINRARNLVMYSGLNIKQITYLMKFDSPQTFSRWFKRNDGKHPSSYKR